MSKIKPYRSKVVFNLDEKSIRTEWLEGKEYYVANAVMMLEGVHPGTGGPILYRGAELNRSTPGWNNKPITAYHPEIDGEPSDAGTDPAVLEKQRIGFALNTSYDEATTKQHTKCWFDKSKTRQIDNRIYQALEEKRKIEVSTGIFLELEEIEGEWNGEKYVGIAHNIQADHLAILIDKIGACSIKKGAGVFANQYSGELSYSDVTLQLSDLLAAKYGEPGKYWPGCICDVYSGYVIFRTDYSSDSMKMIDWNLKGTTVSLSGDAVDVERVVQYQAANGEQVSADAAVFNSKLESSFMNRKVAVDALIANGRYLEKDRKALMDMEEELFLKVAAVAPNQQQTQANNQQAGLAPLTMVNNGQVTPPPNTTTTTTQRTVLNDELAKLSPQHRAVIEQGLAALEAQRSQLVACIKSHPKNAFPDEWLNNPETSIPLLQRIAAIAASPVAPPQTAMVDNQGLTFLGNTSYMGANGAIPINNAELNEAPLVAPEFEFQNRLLPQTQQSQATG